MLRKNKPLHFFADLYVLWTKEGYARNQEKGFKWMCWHTKRNELSLPVVYKTAQLKTGDWKWLWSHYRLQDIIFHGKQETTGKFACRETECPKMTSPVCSCAVFVPHRNWNYTFLVRQNTGKKSNRHRIFFLLKLKTFCHVQSVWVLVGRGGW